VLEGPSEILSKFSDKYLMGIRIALIKQGIGTKFFTSSRNPVVRAHATVARYQEQRLSTRFLADAIIRDCFTIKGEIDREAFAVYAKHLLRFKMDRFEQFEVKKVILAEMERQDDPRFAISAIRILEALGIDHWGDDLLST
jgi:hypothetical protein